MYPVEMDGYIQLEKEGERSPRYTLIFAKDFCVGK